jgi:hypothetical protein
MEYSPSNTDAAFGVRQTMARVVHKNTPVNGVEALALTLGAIGSRSEKVWQCSKSDIVKRMTGYPRSNNPIGRPKGSKNKGPKKARAPVRAVAMEIAAMQGKPMPGRKLGKDVLEEFMMVAAGMAARYRPAPPGQPKKPGQNEAKFLTYAEFAVNCAWKLAEYQSPKFRAIAVRVEDVPAAADVPGPPAENDTSVLQFPSDPVAASKLYLRFMSAIDGK